MKRLKTIWKQEDKILIQALEREFRFPGREAGGGKEKEVKRYEQGWR